MTIKYILNEEIRENLDKYQRQYLVGNLSKPQPLGNIADEYVEVGMTKYSQYGIEKPHYHTTTNEYHYMVAGETKFLDLTNKKSFFFKKGDFFIIYSHIIYAQKSLPGTHLLFTKVPSGNDKVSVREEDFLAAWYADWEIKAPWE